MTNKKGKNKGNSKGKNSSNGNSKGKNSSNGNSKGKNSSKGNHGGDLMTNQERWQALSRSLDEAVEGLTTFDAEGLEWLRQHVRTLTNEYRAQGLTGNPEMLAEILRKHSLLQAVLNATAANLKVLEARQTNTLDRRDETHGYLDRNAEPVPQRPDGRRGGVERHLQ